MNDSEEVMVNLGEMIRVFGGWVDIPGTDLQACIHPEDPADRFYLRKKPTDA